MFLEYPSQMQNFGVDEFNLNIKTASSDQLLTNDIANQIPWFAKVFQIRLSKENMM
jgi:hypothetical protein